MKKRFKLFGIIVLSVISLNMSAQLPNGSIAPNWTLEDINGNEHTLYNYLNQGYTVVIDFSATWCGNCWAYHTSGHLDNLYENFGPDGTEEVMVFFIEGDPNTTIDDLYGTGNLTQGNWVGGTPYPIINSSATADDYGISYWPTIYLICQDSTITEVGTITTEQIYTLARTCILPENSFDASIVEYFPTEGIHCADTLQPVLKLFNSGLDTITDIEIEYRLDDVMLGMHTWKGIMPLYHFEEVIMPVLENLTEGWHTLQMDIITVNGTTDENLIDNQSLTNIYVNPDGTYVKMYIEPGSNPEEISWKIEKNGELIVEGGGYDDDHVYLEDLCLDEVQCYELTIMDDQGNGMSAGSVRVIFEGELLLLISDDDFDSEITETFCVGEYSNSDEIRITEKLEIYPNPSNGSFIVKNVSHGKLEVFNLMGQEIYSETIFSEKQNIKINNIPSGTYFVIVSTENTRKAAKLNIH